MNIIRKDKKNKSLFGYLLNGAVFDSGGVEYMRLSLYPEQSFNAVRLNDGVLARFMNETEIIPLEAELIVRGVMNED